MGRFVFVVNTQAVEGRDEEFNDWYDNVHINEVLATPGFLAAERFRLAPLDPPQSGSPYLSIYEVEAETAQIAREAMAAAAANWNFSEAMDRPKNITAWYESMGPRRTA